jgi:outer membrane biosynthesis protein TonB
VKILNERKDRARQRSLNQVMENALDMVDGNDEGETEGDTNNNEGTAAKKGKKDKKRKNKKRKLQDVSNAEEPSDEVKPKVAKPNPKENNKKRNAQDEQPEQQSSPAGGENQESKAKNKKRKH